MGTVSIHDADSVQGSLHNIKHIGELNNPELTKMWDAYYYALSVNAHPRLRIGDALRVDPEGIRILPDPPDDTACAIASASAETVLVGHEG